jgi:hypothetical protein
MRIFLTHGHDLDAVQRVRTWFARNYPEIELIIFTPDLGDPIPTALELLAAQADAAVVLATPDDFGALRQPPGGLRARARQNVWMELCFFWARLGRHRTMLLLRRSERDRPLEIPSNLSGLAYAVFGRTLSTASRRLHEFVGNAQTLPAEQLTEVISVSSAFVERDLEWEAVRKAARRELWVVGFAMRSQRRWLDFDLDLLRAHPTLNLVFQVVHPDFAAEHRAALSTLHRSNAVEDNHTFFPVLVRSLHAHPDVSERVHLELHEGAPAYSVIVADPPDFGSEMLVQPFVPRTSQSATDHPRLRLRKRTGKGAYNAYWTAIKQASADARASDLEAVGLEPISELLASTRTDPARNA